MTNDELYSELTNETPFGLQAENINRDSVGHPRNHPADAPGQCWDAASQRPSSQSMTRGNRARRLATGGSGFRKSKAAPSGPLEDHWSSPFGGFPPNCLKSIIGTKFESNPLPKRLFAHRPLTPVPTRGFVIDPAVALEDQVRALVRKALRWEHEVRTGQRAAVAEARKASGKALRYEYDDEAARENSGGPR